MKKQNNKTFINPTKICLYKGSYIIELADDASTGFIPDNVVIDGTIATVANGSIEQSIGGINFYSDGKHFCLGYRIKNIKDDKGNLIWENNKNL